MSRLRTGHKPTDWQDEAPSSALIRHPEASIPAEPIGFMRPVLVYGGQPSNKAQTKAPQAFSIHLENRRDGGYTPRRYPTSVMTGARTNPDNGAVEASTTEVRS